MKLYTSIIFFSILCSCGYTQDSSTIWKSCYRNLLFEYQKPWTLLPTLDTKEKTLTGVIDNHDGKSYIIQITDDISKERLSDAKYFDGVKQTMLKANGKNQLIAEDSMIFHGIMAHRQVYLLYSDQWGLLKEINFVIRDGQQFISVQINFPINSKSNELISIPTELVDFDKKVKLNEK